MLQQNLNLNISIRSRRKQYFEGSANSVTSYNERGEFDILPLHANLIGLIKNYVILNKGTAKEKKFVISTGIIRIENNGVEIFLDI